VLEYFKQEDWTLNTQFISHNMHIVRVIWKRRHMRCILQCKKYIR
jgi:hypothetical protein